MRQVGVLSDLVPPRPSKTSRIGIKIQNSESSFPFSCPRILPEPNFCSGQDSADKEAKGPRRPGACQKHTVLASGPNGNFQPSIFFHFCIVGAFAPRVSYHLHCCHSYHPLSPVPEALVSTSPASRPQPTSLVPPRSQSVSSLCTQDTDEGHLCLGVETPGRRAGSHLFYYPHCPGSPLLGLSSPSWPSWPWGTVCTAKTKQRSNINF